MKGALVEIGFGPKKPSAKAEASGETAMGDEAKTEAAQRILDALKAKDPEALSAALEDHYAACAMGDEEPDAEDEEE